MKQWLSQNAGTVFSLALLVAIILFASFKAYKRRKSGKQGCGCHVGCAQCPMKNQCSVENIISRDDSNKKE